MECDRRNHDPIVFHLPDGPAYIILIDIDRGVIPRRSRDIDMVVCSTVAAQCNNAFPESNISVLSATQLVSANRDRIRFSCIRQDGCKVGIPNELIQAQAGQDGLLPCIGSFGIERNILIV